jgi:hypothetical protein
LKEPVLDPFSSFFLLGITLKKANIHRSVPRPNARPEKLDKALFVEMPSFVLPACHSSRRWSIATKNTRTGMCQIWPEGSDSLLQEATTGSNSNLISTLLHPAPPLHHIFAATPAREDSVRAAEETLRYNIMRGRREKRK